MLQNLLGAAGANPQNSPSSDVFAVNAYLALFRVFATESGFAAPAFAALTVTTAFHEKLKHLQQVCTAHNLSEVRTFMVVDFYSPAGIEKRLGLINPELVVTPTSFWFADESAAGTRITTCITSIDVFSASPGKPGEAVMFDLTTNEVSGGLIQCDHCAKVYLETALSASKSQLRSMSEAGSPSPEDCPLCGAFCHPVAYREASQKLDA